MNDAERPSKCNLLEDNEEEGGYDPLIDAPSLGSAPTGEDPLAFSDDALNGMFLGSSQCHKTSYQCTHQSTDTYRGMTYYDTQATGGESGMTNAQRRKAIEEESSSESGVTREIIHDWTDKANISFEYSEKKADELVKKAKEKMKKINCNHLKCTQCDKLFPSKDELRKHYYTEEHIAKVREKSVSKTLGDLKTFAGASQNILSRVMGLSSPNQPSSPAATAQQPLGAGSPNQQMSLDAEIYNLYARSPANLQGIIQEVIEKLKKGEDGYELENDKYFRVMSVLSRSYSSERELMANLLMCFVKINRKGGDYGERQPKRGRDEDKGEKAPKKRKKD